MAPKPEMLEKAEAALEHFHPDGIYCEKCVRVALALEEERKDALRLELLTQARLYNANVGLESALRASEAALAEARVCHICESHLSKSQVTCRWCVRRAFQVEYDEKLQKALESSRAEATKAERERAANLVHAQRCYPYHAADGCPCPSLDLAETAIRKGEPDPAIRAPRPPEPETPPGWDGVYSTEACKATASSPPPHVHTYDCSGNLGGFDCPEPPPPSEEREMADTRIFGKCNAFCSWFVTGEHVKGCMAVPSPEPTREEPAK